MKIAKKADVAVIEGDTVDETNIAEITKTSTSIVPLYIKQQLLIYQKSIKLHRGLNCQDKGLYEVIVDTSIIESREWKN